MNQEIPEHIKQQLERKNSEIERLQAVADLTTDWDPILVDLAHSLRLADFASHPAKSTPLEQRVSGSNNRPEPGSTVRAARKARQRLRATVENAIKQFHISAEHHWYPPRPEPEPRRRCKNRVCDSANVPIPKYVGRAGSRIELVRCPSCDNKLYDA